MYLRKLALLNFKNIAESELHFGRGINCLVGDNGAGKTNYIDAVHYLSMCKSALGSTDPGALNKNVEADFFMLTGNYLSDAGSTGVVRDSHQEKA